MFEARFILSRGIVRLTGWFLIPARRNCQRRRRSRVRRGRTRPWKRHKSPWRCIQRDDYHSDCQSYRGEARKMSEPPQNQLKLDRFTHHYSDKNMLGEFRERRPCTARSAVLVTTPLADATSAAALRPPASIARKRPATAALPAGHRLRVARDLLPALRRLLRAIAVAAPRRQERAIAEPQRRETDRAPPLTDAGTARREQDAAQPRARLRPRGPDFSGSGFRFLIVRGRAVLAEGPRPAECGCATRARRHARGCLAPHHWCWDSAARPPPADHAALPRARAGRLVVGLQARPPSSLADPALAGLRLAPHHSCWDWVRHRLADHAALPRACAGRSAKGPQARPPSSLADPALAGLRAHLLGLHCAVHPARRPLWAKYRAHLVRRADLRAGCVGRAGPDCRATLPVRGPDRLVQRLARQGGPRVLAAARAAREPRLAWARRAGWSAGRCEVLCQASVHSNLPVGFVL
jgi:hypothetical protein